MESKVCCVEKGKLVIGYVGRGIFDFLFAIVRRPEKEDGGSMSR